MLSVRGVSRNLADEIVYSYSLLFASRGANVVVNDFNAEAAQKVVDEIVKGAFVVRSRYMVRPD